MTTLASAPVRAVGRPGAAAAAAVALAFPPAPACRTRRPGARLAFGSTVGACWRCAVCRGPAGLGGAAGAGRRSGRRRRLAAGGAGDARALRCFMATGFLPVVGGDRWRALSRDEPTAAWLVSTDMPRERLAALGPPFFDLARADERVKAELLMHASGEVLAGAGGSALSPMPPSLSFCVRRFPPEEPSMTVFQRPHRLMPRRACACLRAPSSPSALRSWPRSPAADAEAPAAAGAFHRDRAAPAGPGAGAAGGDRGSAGLCCPRWRASALVRARPTVPTR